MCFSLCTTSQSAGEQRECGAVWPLQYMCVLEARASGQWLSHSHPGPQRYQLWNEASLTVFRKSSEQVVCFRLFTFLSVHLCSDKQTKEDIVDAASSSHCFSELQPETVYRISVHSRVGTVEGAAVTILHPTGRNPVWVILQPKWCLFCSTVMVCNSLIKQSLQWEFRFLLNCIPYKEKVKDATVKACSNQTQIFPWAFSEIRILNRNNAYLFIYSHQTN